MQAGLNLSVAIGPYGRTAEGSGSANDAGDVAASYAYSSSVGLFAGVGLDGLGNSIHHVSYIS